MLFRQIGFSLHAQKQKLASAPSSHFSLITKEKNELARLLSTQKSGGQSERRLKGQQKKVCDLCLIQALCLIRL